MPTAAGGGDQGGRADLAGLSGLPARETKWAGGTEGSLSTYSTCTLVQCTGPPSVRPSYGVPWSAGQLAVGCGGSPGPHVIRHRSPPPLPPPPVTESACMYLLCTPTQRSPRIRSACGQGVTGERQGSGEGRDCAWGGWPESSDRATSAAGRRLYISAGGSAPRNRKWRAEYVRFPQRPPPPSPPSTCVLYSPPPPTRVRHDRMPRVVRWSAARHLCPVVGLPASRVAQRLALARLGLLRCQLTLRPPPLG